MPEYKPRGRTAVFIIIGAALVFILGMAIGLHYPEWILGYKSDVYTYQRPQY